MASDGTSIGDRFKRYEKEYVVKVANQLGEVEEKKLNDVHKVLFRITSRTFNLSMGRLREKYWNKTENSAFSREFLKLCRVRNNYWRLFKKTDE